MNHSLQRVRRQFALQRFYRQRQQTLAVAAHEFFARRRVRPLLQRELQRRAQRPLVPFHLRIGEGQQLLDALQGIIVLRAPFQNRPQAFRHHGANQRTLGRKVAVGGRTRYLRIRRQFGDRRKRAFVIQRHRAGQQQTVGFCPGGRQ